MAELHAETGQRQAHGPENRPPGLAETSRRIEELGARHRELTARIAERHNPPGPAKAPIPAFPLETSHRRTAILQPPNPEIPPSPWIPERLAGRDQDHEATD